MREYIHFWQMTKIVFLFNFQYSFTVEKSIVLSSAVGTLRAATQFPWPGGTRGLARSRDSLAENATSGEGELFLVYRHATRRTSFR